MSSFDARKIRTVSMGARLRSAMGAAMAAGLLAGCGENGFRPLNGQAGIGANVDAKLATIEIAPIPSRVGQRIRNELKIGRAHV